MKEIKLTQNKVALVDDEDYEMLSFYKWYATKSRNTYYATAHVKYGTRMHLQRRKYYKITMHRLILGTTNTKEICDHIDRNGLNNQRINLRIVTNSENLKNSYYHDRKCEKNKNISLDCTKSDKD